MSVVNVSQSEADTALDSVSLPETPLTLSVHLGFTTGDRAKQAWYEIAGGVLSHYLVDQPQRLKALLQWFYQDLGFRVHQDYYGVQAADLATCLLNRQGNSTTLSTLLMLLAKQLDLKLEMILLPGHSLLQWQHHKITYYIDPLTGHFVDRQFLHAIVRGELGNAAPLKASYLKPVTVKRLLTRLLHEIKAGCILKGQFEPALECCNLLLQWHPEDAHLNRERAFIAQQLGCISLAAADLTHFIENSPHDPVIELVKLQLKELVDKPEVYH
ncbi:tetratricopeptide repeat protein [Shewanella sp. NIFS-20-20]|uniref:transglutaminase family protein n=1 Tax=Shewanella sp. NIFS-20-20 TaxID=2853806 RepID=UPI001C482359|nr:tetratricopeptide repeat protein [Shewanella sp. NIFS-20-20]MBV7315902.1 tetratricopeptide repeat protein [Shewanella sp. NIFS-20-20]